MSKAKKNNIDVQAAAIAVVSNDTGDFISLTDMAKKFGDDGLIYNWMRNRNTLEFIGIWEKIHNPEFKGLEFETFRNQAGLNRFSLTPRKWIEATGAIGFQSKAGRYGGGTYAHKDIAFEFGSWLSPEFKLYLIKEFQRLKDEENDRLKLDWETSSFQLSVFQLFPNFGLRRLCQRSGSIQRRPFRPNRQTMARSQSRCRGKRP